MASSTSVPHSAATTTAAAVVDPHQEPFRVPTLAATMVTSPLQRKLIGWRFRLANARLLMARLRSPLAMWRAIRQRTLRRNQYAGRISRTKVARVAGRYYRDYAVPGWPSAAYAAHFANMINRFAPNRSEEATLDMVVLAITKKCPLSCEHCFEWDELNRKERLSLADLRVLVARFQARKVTKIMLSGGEPMLRIHDIVEVLRTAKAGTDFWVLTSGVHLTQSNAAQLRAAGLTGVSISLDHYDAQAHNAFRGSERAFENAIQAATHARQAGLVVNLALCVTREFTTEANLMAYAELAKRLGVAFIQLLEPRSVGHYAGQDVALGDDQLSLLEQFYERLNFSPEYRDWPIVSYSGYHQRRLGCSGAGIRFLYVDTDGDLHACPFCQTKSGSALDCSLDESLAKLRSRGCHKFDSSSI